MQSVQISTKTVQVQTIKCAIRLRKFQVLVHLLPVVDLEKDGGASKLNTLLIWLSNLLYEKTINYFQNQPAVKFRLGTILSRF